jgi:hypothetical protein
MPTPVHVRLELMIHALGTIEGRERLRMAWDGAPEDGGPFQQLWGILTGMALLGYPETDREAVLTKLRACALRLGDEHTFHGFTVDALTKALKQVISYHDLWIERAEPRPPPSEESPLDRVERIMAGEEDPQLWLPHVPTWTLPKGVQDVLGGFYYFNWSPPEPGVDSPP